MSAPVNIPSRPSGIEVNDTDDEEDRMTGHEDCALPQGLEALGSVSPMRASTREKWRASPSPKTSTTLEALEKRLAEAEARREKFRAWMMKTDEAPPSTSRVSRAQQRRQSAINSRREAWRTRIDSLMEGAPLRHLESHCVHSTVVARLSTPCEFVLSRERVDLSCLTSRSLQTLQLLKSEGFGGSPRVWNASSSLTRAGTRSLTKTLTETLASEGRRCACFGPDSRDS